MNIIVNFIYGFTILLLFIPSHAPAMMRHMQEQATEPKLELWHNDQKIAEIPVSVAKNVSPVFKQQLCGSKVFDTRLCPSMEMKQDKVTMGQDSLKIDCDEFDPETIILFTRMVNAPTVLANPLATLVLQKKLVNDHSDLVLDLYGFLAKYDINEYMPLLAEQFVSALASTSKLYNRAEFPFAMDNQLHLLSQAICSLSPFGIVLVQKPHIINHTNVVVNTAVFSPDSKYVVTSSHDGTAQIYDIEAQKVIGTIAHNCVVISAQFSPDGKYVVTASFDRTARIYDIEKEKVIRTIRHTEGVISAQFSPDGKYVVTASNDGLVTASNGGTAKIYDIEKEKFIGAIAHNCVVISAQFSPDGKYVVTTANDRAVRIYDIEKEKVIGTIQHSAVKVIFSMFRVSAQFSPDGKYVVTAYGGDNKAQIYDIEKEKVIGTIAHTDGVVFAEFSPDGKYVVTASNDGTAQIYEIEKEKVIGTIQHTAGLVSAKFSPDGKYAVTASYDKTVLIYDVKEKQVIGTIPHARVVNSARFSPDGKYLATASHVNGIVHICDIEKKQVIGIIKHARVVNGAQFSPDGKYVVTASQDNTARITPFTLCGMSDIKIITIATLIDLAKLMAAAEDAAEDFDPLIKTGWLYKEFEKFSYGDKQRLFAQFPHIKQLIDTAKDENEGGPVHEQNKKRSREQDDLGKEDDSGKAPEGKRQK